MKILYYDCFAGISGDMNMGAFLDLGVDYDYVVDALKMLPLSGYELRVGKERRKEIEGTRFEVIPTGGEPHHRNMEDIRTIIETSTLSERVKKTSTEIFLALAKAESKIHGVDLDQVHLHEVGATDSIIDIVGAALCLEFTGVDRILSSPVELGSGLVKCSHGILPVPAPATMEILRNAPVRIGGVNHEATTPTGAAILAATVGEFVERIDFRPGKVGYGIGTRDGEIPNVLRIIMGETTGHDVPGYEQGEAIVVECTIDDMNPELYEHVIDKLLDAGAFDVFLTPVVMKKSRPGVMVTVICSPTDAVDVRDAVLRETSTFGIREYRVDRCMFARTTTVVRTRYGPVRVKHALRDGKRVKSKPEFEDCKKLAEKHNVPITEIYAGIRYEE